MNIILSAFRPSMYKPSLTQHNPTQASGAYGVPPTQSTTDHFTPTQRSGDRFDPVRDYLGEIGRVSLLRPVEEIELAHQIQAGWKILQGLRPQIGPIRNSKDKIIQNPGFAALYAWYIKKHSSLQLEAEQKIAIRKAKRAYDQMMTANLRLVVSIAKKYKNNGLELLDLIQEGNLGLAIAADKFDHRKGYKFSTYATWWIRQAMQRAIAVQGRTIRLPVHVDEKLSKLRKVTRELYQKLGRTPTREEVATAMEMTIEKLQALLQSTQPAISSDWLVREKGTTSLIAFIADTETPSPSKVLEASLRKEGLNQALESLLNERERDVLRLRFGLDDGRQRTLEEVGGVFDVTRERIRQILQRALRKLRESDSTLLQGLLDE
ncbi:MAG: RNA polymerase sigma factor RpoD/SigA [Vampirovibrionales bacterium]